MSDVCVCVCCLSERGKEWKEKKKGKESCIFLKKSGNLTISVCNEAGGLFGAKVSRALWVVGVRLCGIGKVARRKKALKSEGKKAK